MKKLGIGTLFALAFGLALMLSAAPASAQICGMCTCQNSCDDFCESGPEIIDCPECNDSTCGASGPACGGCSSCGVTSNCTRILNGTASGETLSGDSRHDCINGLGGDDTISGQAGDDTIHGNDGNDTIYGGSGHDCLFGDAGGDNLTGDSGIDVADGGTGTDTCTAETEVSCEF